MGIQGLNRLLKRHASHAFGEITLDQLRGTRVAIDCYNWIHSSYPTAKKAVVYRTDVSKEDPDEDEIFREWMGVLFEFIRNWVNYSITPVFVFDGVAPMEKGDTRKKRRENQQKTKDRMVDARDKIRNSDPLLVTAAMIDDLRKRMVNTRSIADESIEYMKVLLKKLGIPYLQAKNEGEQLCSMLAREGIVSAVYSTDTDNLAYGAPLLITRFSGLKPTSTGYVLKCKCVWYDNILKQLDYTHDKFVDLCILAGCDYNMNMPKIAILTAYKLLNEYQTIDAFPTSKYIHLHVLKHHRCREMFTPIPSESLCEEGFMEYQGDKLDLLQPHLEQLEIFDRQHYLVTLFYKLERPSTELTLPPPPDIPIIKKYSNITLIIVPT